MAAHNNEVWEYLKKNLIVDGKQFVYVYRKKWICESFLKYEIETWSLLQCGVAGIK